MGPGLGLTQDQTLAAPNVLLTLIKRADQQETLPLSCIPTAYHTLNGSFMLWLAELYMMASSSCPTARICAFAWDGHKSYIPLDNVLLNLKPMPDSGQTVPSSLLL